MYPFMTDEDVAVVQKQVELALPLLISAHVCAGRRAQAQSRGETLSLY